MWAPRSSAQWRSHHWLFLRRLGKVRLTFSFSAFACRFATSSCEVLQRRGLNFENSAFRTQKILNLATFCFQPGSLLTVSPMGHLESPLV